MAKKGQKFSRYTDESFKLKVVRKYLSGISSTYLSKEYNIPKGTIKTWTTKYRKYGNLTNDILKQRGRKKEKNLTLEDWKERYEIAKKYQAFLKAQREKR